MSVQRFFSGLIFFLFIILINSGCVQNGGDKAVTTLAEQITVEVTTTEETSAPTSSTIPEVAGKSNGESCSSSTDCSSYSCKDGVCCDSDQCGYLGKCYNSGVPVRDCVCIGGELMLCGTATTTARTIEVTTSTSGTTRPVHVTTTLPVTTTTLVVHPFDDEFSEEEIKTPKGYYLDNNVISVGGKIAYTLRDYNSPAHYILFDGLEYGKEYKATVSPADVGGKLAYAVETGSAMSGNTKAFFVYDGKEYGREYDSADTPVLIGGIIAYRACHYGSGCFIVYGGKEYGKEYEGVDFPASVGGKLAYRASKAGSSFVVYDGKTFGDKVALLGSINDKMVYSECSSGECNMVYDGKKSAERYQDIDSFYNVNGKLAYVASSNGNDLFVVYDGKEYGRGDGYARNPVGIKGGLAFIAGKYPLHSNNEYIAYKGKRISKTYEDIMNNLMVIQGKLAFVGCRASHCYLAMQK
jgi:hypothetical protein